MAYESINSNNGKTVKKFAQVTDEQLESKIAKAAHAYVNKKMVRTHDMAAPQV